MCAVIVSYVCGGGGYRRNRMQSTSLICALSCFVICRLNDGRVVVAQINRFRGIAALILDVHNNVVWTDDPMNNCEIGTFGANNEDGS